MSENIYESKDGKLVITKFWGGISRGRCYQITFLNSYIELDEKHFKMLKKWVRK